MAKASYLRMCIDAKLKVRLQELAHEENRTLTNFIETEFRKIVAVRGGNRKSAMAPRQARAARLTMCINAELRAKLQEMAKEDYRNLADFVETRLREIISARKPKRTRRMTVHKAMRNRRVRPRQAGAARLSIRINADLKSELRELANEGHRTLTDFVEDELHQIASAPKARRGSLMPRRRVRDAHFTMRISTELKAKLQELANEQYRTLTDFIEIELRQTVATRTPSTSVGSAMEAVR